MRVRPISWRSRAWLLLGVTVLLLIAAIMILGGRTENGAAETGQSDRRTEVVLLVLLGSALLGGCLHVYPKALLEKTTVRGMNRLTAENDIRTLLAEIVGGAFLLTGLYFTYGQLQETANQAAIARERLSDQRYENAMDRVSSSSSGIRALGIAGLERLMPELEPDEKRPIYAVLAAQIRQYAPWTEAKKKRWATLSREVGRKAEADHLVGVGSLRKRAPDVQAALGVLSERKQIPFRVDLREVDLQGAELGHAWLPGAIFSGAHLDYLDCRTGQGPYADFQGADFEGASLYGAYFNNANLTAAVFRTPINEDGTRRTSQTTDLRDAHFRGATLVRTDFEAANLAGANFSPTKVGTTNLSNAIFKDATLTGADFEKANLTGADLTGAKLIGANLAGADLRDATLDGADLHGARYDHTTQWPAGYWVDAGRTVVE
jgi:uncharacterized protein YjbI with pentapeptide repeats